MTAGQLDLVPNVWCRNKKRGTPVRPSFRFPQTAAAGLLLYGEVEVAAVGPVKLIPFVGLGSVVP